jgi:thymidylate kinase
MAELYFRPGSLVVFEGLDRTGKSTQLERLSMLDWSVPRPIFTHMPSGMTALTKDIYSLTENLRISSPFARQLLHLACHAENITSVADGRAQHGLFLDRWWWSTVAYGWYAGHLAESGVSESAFFGVIESIWSGQPADVIFLFMTPFESDELNREEVRNGYLALAKEHASTTVVVPPGDPEVTTALVLRNLRDRELLR